MACIGGGEPITKCLQIDGGGATGAELYL